MGPENSGEPTKLYMMVDGEPVEIRPGAFSAKITYAEEAVDCEPLEMREREFTIRIDYPKALRCRNRKRFVKLLMARGHSRNEAKKAANYIVWAHRRGRREPFTKSYQQYFTGLWFWAFHD